MESRRAATPSIRLGGEDPPVVVVAKHLEGSEATYHRCRTQVRRLQALLVIPAESARSDAVSVTGWFARIAGETGRTQPQV